MSPSRLQLVKYVKQLPVQFGGEQHSGWLPPGAAVPLPTPIENVVFDVEILHDGHGYLLCYSAHDGSRSGDTWHQTIADAERAAEEFFGIEATDWQAVD